jgi:pyrroline-5-carboxylate reductase
MAQAMITGLLRNDSTQKIYIHGGASKRTEAYAASAGIEYLQSNEAVVSASDIVILAVLPHQLATVAAEIRTKLADRIVISVLGGVSLTTLEDHLGYDALILRTLPNVNVAVNSGMIAIAGNANLQRHQEAREQVRSFLGTLGSTMPLPEDEFSTFSALAGSSPAFIELFVDAMAQAGVKHGMDKDMATQIVAQAMIGTARMIQSSPQSPRDLAAAVSSPGGSTIAGFLAMEEAGLTSAVVKGIDATIEKDRSVD